MKSAKFILQITAGVVLGYFAILGISFLTWQTILRPKLYSWEGGLNAEMAVRREQQAEQNGAEEGREEAYASWQNENKAEWSEVKAPHLIIGMDANQKMLVLGRRDNAPFVSEAQAQMNLKKCREAFPQYEFVVVNVEGAPRE
jgi:hypothetical protein